MKHVLLLGKPCSGKGTLSKFLEDHGFYHLSGSDMLREHISDPEAKYYHEANYALTNGIMIKDEIINGIFKEKIKTISNDERIVFDGYPRSVAQARTIVEHFGAENICVFYLDVSDEECLSRLNNRLTCKKCASSFSKTGKYKPYLENRCDYCVDGELYVRTDDKPENFKNKLVEYDLLTKPIVDFVKENNILISKIDGSESKKFQAFDRIVRLDIVEALFKISNLEL